MKRSAAVPPRIALAVLLLLIRGAFLEAQVAAVQPEGARWLERLSSEAGQVLPSASFPYSGSYLFGNVTALQGRAGDRADPQLQQMGARLAGQDGAAIDAAIAVTYERYVRPDIALPLGEYLQVVDPFVVLELSYQLDLSLAVYVEAVALREYRVGMGGDNWLPYRDGNPVALENNMVQQGYLYFNPGPFEITFGRQKVSIGPSPFTSIAISRAVPFLDALNLKANLGRLRMTLLLSTLENRSAQGDVTIPTADYAFSKTVILYNTHYFEYDFGFLRAGIGSSVLITRPDNAFQISDFFPVFSWHNANIVPNNLSLFLDVSAVPLRGVKLYGQFGFDDINAGFAGAHDTGIPTIWAGLLGAEWFGGLASVPLSAAVEVGYTHYLWGSFDDDVPLARAIYRMDLDGPRQWMPLTSPFGPGAAWVIAEVTAETPWHLSSTLSFRLVSRNTLASLAGPYVADPIVRNAARTLALQTGLGVIYRPFPWLKATVNPVLHVEDGTAWLELEAGAGAHLEGKRVLR